MSDERRIRQLLEEVLESGCTPEHACRDFPELLDRVRQRLRAIKALDADVETMFPSSGPAVGVDLRRRFREGLVSGTDLPRIPGHVVDAVLGSGGMGVVYRATHLKLHRAVAIKMLLQGPFATKEDLECLLREAESVAGLHHPNIVQVYDVGELDGLPYFTMEFLEGGTLAQKLAGVPQPARAAAMMIATLAGAVQAAHQGGVVHRDLKPTNILLAADGTLKIADFSLARRFEGDSAITLGSAAVGTPSYMAPEQALGKAEAFSPAVDIYSLGALLYETLTGRPPFKAETPLETRRQVIEEEPAAPSRLNAKVPRDLETICLKCLHKDPARRYASAAELHDDLQRFLSGEPVRARPVSAAEKAVKWARRRPSAALLLVAVLALLGTGVGVAMWRQNMQGQRRVELAAREASARQVVETSLVQADEMRQQERWAEGMRILAAASTRLDDTGDPGLVSRVNDMLAELHLAQDLERIGQSHLHSSLASNDIRTTERAYAQVLRSAGVETEGNPEAIAKGIRAHRVSAQIVAALDDWAFVAFSNEESADAERLEAIARAADPDGGWRDQLRHPEIWNDRRALLELADEAEAGPPHPPAKLLGLLGTLLGRAGADSAGLELLTDALRRRPNDFWITWELASALHEAGRDAEVVGMYRAAIALRPDNALVFNALATVLAKVGRIDDAISVYRKAVEIDPVVWLPRYNLVAILVDNGHWGEARAECDRAIAADPTSAVIPVRLGELLITNQQYDEALVVLRRAMEADPSSINARGGVAWCLTHSGKFAESQKMFQECLESDPKNEMLHGWLGDSYRFDHKLQEAAAEYQKAVDLSPSNGLFHTNLGELLFALERPAEAVASFQRAIAITPDSAHAWKGLATAKLLLGEFAEAREAARHTAASSDLSQRRASLRQMDLCERLIALQAVSPDVLAGRELPVHIPDKRTLAEWYATSMNLPVTATRLYKDVFAAQPELLNNVDSDDRRIAARAAAMGGCAFGKDSANADENERHTLRMLAFDWLSKERDDWAARHASGAAGQKTAAAAAFRDLLTSSELACVRDEPDVNSLPDDEKETWRALWADMQGYEARDPDSLIEQARLDASHGRWAEATSAYARSLSLEPSNNAEYWFEYAAVQLLAGDRPGYLRTCDQMLKTAEGPAPLRPFLVTRACTLSAVSPDQMKLAATVGEKELQGSASQFWSLSEQAAVLCRLGQYTEAAPLLERSLAANPKPGAAVVNWLWLAIADQHAGEVRGARRWFSKASNWLGPLHEEMPPNAGTVNLHLHNWLEAQVLLREAQSLIPAPAPVEVARQDADPKPHGTPPAKLSD